MSGTHVSAPASFAERWDRQARDRGGERALVDVRRSLTWHEAAELSGRLATGLLSLGIRPGQIVACWLPNWVEFYVLRIACERAGLIWLPIPANLREWELQVILSQAGVSALVVPQRFREMDYVAAAQALLEKLPGPPYRIIVVGSSPGNGITLAEVAHVGSRPSAPSLPESTFDEAVVILPTSGSTGPPKFVQYRVSAWLLRGQSQVELLKLREDDLIVSLTQGIGPSIIPLFAVPLVGAAVYLVDQFEPGLVIKTLTCVRPTIVCGVPAQFTTLVSHPDWPPGVLERIRIWYSTGAALPRATAERLEATTSGIALSGYGGVDFGGWAAPSLSDPPAVRHTTVGRPRGNTELRLVDETDRDVPAGEVGEIWGRGPCCSVGYFRDEASAQERWTPDGWFRTGDLARLDSDGNLVIVGRKGEMIRRGSRSIFPAEIEGLLSSHPKILKVAVVGIPDSVLGERACACVVPKAGEILTLEEVTASLRAQGIASFKLPERLELLSDLPLKGDKVDRAALREKLLG